MKRTILMLGLLLLSVVVQAQSLSEPQIDAAIKQGLAKKAAWVIVTKPLLGKYYGVVLDGPYSRIVRAATEAADKYLPFTRDQVTPELLADTLLVTAYPPTPIFSFGSWTIAPPASHLVLQAKGSAAVQPLKVEIEPVSWSNAAGGTFTSTAISATFLLSAVPMTEFDVVVVMDGRDGEQRATVKPDKRKQIR